MCWEVNILKKCIIIKQKRKKIQDYVISRNSSSTLTRVPLLHYQSVVQLQRRCSFNINILLLPK